MDLYFAIFAGLAVLGLRPGWRIFRRQFGSVVDHFEQDEAVARFQDRVDPPEIAAADHPPL